MKRTTRTSNNSDVPDGTMEPVPSSSGYQGLLGAITEVLENARRVSARTVNALMTATYWEVGRRIVEFEQRGKKRAEYGLMLIESLSRDLTTKFGRGFGTVNLSQMKKFYLLWPAEQIFQTPSEKSKVLTTQISLRSTAECFPLPWSSYVRLLSVQNEHARRAGAYEEVAGGKTIIGERQSVGTGC